MRALLAGLLSAACLVAADLPPNRWVELAKDPAGARRGSAIRYAPAIDAFLLWGFMNDDPELLQEHPLIRVPEYDMVAFDPDARRWENQFPPAWERLWRKRLPLAYVPRTYAGITSGSERTVMRSPTDDEPAAPRPDLNIVFDQVAYRETDASLYYFTGGLTAAYDVRRRRWRDLRPRRSPPPVLGGSLVWDPVADELILFGGGHVAERGPDGKVRGYTGTWVFRPADGEWRRLSLVVEPPPRMQTRMVCDRRNGVVVLFGGDGQSHYLADTWLFDLKTRRWRKSQAPGGPEARAGHFTVWDPGTGWVIVGGGYNRRDLTDMWAYDAAEDRWRKLNGRVPTGFYINGDIAPERRLIVLVTNTRRPGDRSSCNTLYPVRTTYGYRIEKEGIVDAAVPVRPQQAIPKRPPEESAGTQSDPRRRATQRARLESLPENEWVLLADPGRAAITRTWGSATFDTRRERILYWGGGHCGYGGNDVDVYDLAEHTWIGGAEPEFPGRTWDKGVRLAGVTFRGGPWTTHGRKAYAYDPVGDRLINVVRMRLTTGYEPEWAHGWPESRAVAADALVRPPSSYKKFVTWSWDPETREWTLIGPAPEGVDTVVTTPHGVVGVRLDWRSRLNDAGYLLPWRPDDPPQETSVWLLRGSDWERVDRSGPWPQNLYEMTSLAWDSKRERLLLHGGGARRDELWAFQWAEGRWTNLQPKVAGGGKPPVCSREAVYIPGEDVLLTYGRSRRGELPPMWAYTAAENTWRRVEIPIREGEELHRRAGQNRAMVYDPQRGLVLLVLGARGDEGRAAVFALRYRNHEPQ